MWRAAQGLTGEAGVAQRDLGLVPALFEPDRDDGFEPFRRFRHPMYFHLAALDAHRANISQGCGRELERVFTPRRVRRTSLARASTPTCLQTALSDIENGAATSEMRAGRRASRSKSPSASDQN